MPRGRTRDASLFHIWRFDCLALELIKWDPGQFISHIVISISYPAVSLLHLTVFAVSSCCVHPDRVSHLSCKINLFTSLSFSANRREQNYESHDTEFRACSYPGSSQA
jgi:hypothetical protein